MNPLINKKQISKFYTMLSNAHLKDQKEALISSFTDGRTISIREVTRDEFKLIIDYLQGVDPCEKMRKKIFAILFKLHWIVDGNAIEWKINLAKINNFLKHKGAVKKPFYELRCDEVEKVLRQFESIQKHEADSKERREVDEYFKQVIGELGIDTASN